MDILPADEFERSDFGMLIARSVCSGVREDIDICYRDDPQEPSHYASIMTAWYEILPNDDKVLRSASYQGGDLSRHNRTPLVFQHPKNWL